MTESEERPQRRLLGVEVALGIREIQYISSSTGKIVQRAEGLSVLATEGGSKKDDLEGVH